VHSRLADVWVIEQFQPHALNEHLLNGRPWDLDRNRGGLRIMPPFTGAHGAGFAGGNADVLHRHRALIAEFAPDEVVVMSADHVERVDLRDVLDAHREAAAEVTMVTTEVGADEASRFGLARVDAATGRVTGWRYKPDEPFGTTAATEVFAYDARALFGALDALAADLPDADDDGTPELEDFGHHLLPRLVDAGRAYAFRHEGYWRDVGTLPSYWEGHMDLLRDELIGPGGPLSLDDPAWPMRTAASLHMPVRLGAHGARRRRARLARRVGGRHGRASVLGPAWWSRRGPRCATACCCTASRCGAAARRARGARRRRRGGGGGAGGRGRGELCVVGQRCAWRRRSGGRGRAARRRGRRGRRAGRGPQVSAPPDAGPGAGPGAAPGEPFGRRPSPPAATRGSRRAWPAASRCATPPAPTPRSTAPPTCARARGWPPRHAAGERFAVVQDDANFLALVDPATGLADAVTFPAGVGGRRTFSKAEGTKEHKLDLEACCMVAHPSRPGERLLVAFGSGSTDRREQVVVVEGLETGPADAARVTLVDASALYAALRRSRRSPGRSSTWRAPPGWATGPTPWCACSRAATARGTRWGRP
jgi:glucose-1-phosphate adenylyltransferase